MRRLTRPLLVLMALVALVTIVLARVGTFQSRPAQALLVPPGGLPGELAGPAPWPRNVVELRHRLAVLGLPALGAEGTALHTHQHLDVFVNGRRITVPAGIGIDAAGRFISPLHTHDSSGVVHVESPTVQAFTLGQFFGVWGVRFTPGCLGDYCETGGSRLWVFSDGTPVKGDPRLVPLEEHEEIVVAFGTRAQLPRPIPGDFAFPAGL
jgi:hypothetical protein